MPISSWACLPKIDNTRFSQPTRHHWRGASRDLLLLALSILKKEELSFLRIPLLSHRARYITLISTDTLSKFRLCQTCVLTSIEQYLCIVFFPGLCRSLFTTLSTNLAKFPCKFGTYIINFILFAHNIQPCFVAQC